MLWLNWKLALIVLVVVPVLALVTAYFQRRLLQSSRDIRRTNSQITAGFSEGIMGVGTSKVLVRESENLEEFQSLSGAMHRYSVRNALQSAVYLPLVISLGAVGVGLALWRGGVMLNTGEGMTVGALIAFMQYATLYSMPIQELAMRFTELQNAQAAAERVQGLIDTEPEIRDAPEVAARVAELAGREREPGVAADGHADAIGEVRFEGVDFWYEPDEIVLEGFDLTVRAGQTVALVGATGGGKSTIVNLVSRFYEPKRGAILIDGVEYRQRSLSWLQSKLGIVLQTPHLFSATIRENIRYGDLSASDAAIEEAARLVNAHEFIAALPDGYDTGVGEGGARLSTGQRQLIALARAVVADPSIFIMDEATSSVDTETERLIQKGIERVLEGRIAFVIAHRLSTIRSADVILVIERGRIVEQGDHEELLRRRGAYFRLHAEQFGRGG
jgi:ATP-binding cassette subfamily B protein